MDLVQIIKRIFSILLSIVIMWITFFNETACIVNNGNILTDGRCQRKRCR